MNESAPPSWLEQPPTSYTRPPVRTLAQGLPFEELEWVDFERLILQLVRRAQDVLACHVYGTPGQAQHGIDLLAALRDSADDKGCYQCKKVERFGPADIRKAVRLFEDGPWAAQVKEFTLCVACALESTDVVEEIAEQRTRLAQRDIRFIVWDGSRAAELNTRLKSLPKVVDDFFGREWVRIFNGDEAAAALGERLDGVDFSLLRSRLADLYATIFSQHDPGLQPSVPEPVDYDERYVPADVVESTRVEGPIESRLKSIGEIRAAKDPLAGAPKRDTVLPDAFATDVAPTRRNVWEWLRDRDSCIILGEPGYGKSALLRHLALTLARAAFGNDAPVRSVHLRRLPVWLSFARFAAAIADDPNANVADFFIKWLHQYGYPDVHPLFQRALRTCDFVLIVDGLDEAATSATGREALDRLISFAQSHRAIIICTARPRGLGTLTVPSTWPTVALAPFSDEQITEFAIRWFALLEVFPYTDPPASRRVRARPRGEAFFDAVRTNQRTQELARNPLLCQAFIEMFRLSHRLPEARVRAYSEVVDLFIRRHPQARAHAGLITPPSALDETGVSDLREILIQLALDMQSDEIVGTSSRARCAEVCATYLEDDLQGLGMAHPKAVRRASELVDCFIAYFGILIERSPGEISFVHLSLQEFLAADGMTRKSESEQLSWLKTIALAPRWRECLISWFGILGDNGRRPLGARGLVALSEVAVAGEWERLQVLELSTELACSDVGLPVGDARNILANAKSEIETSPYPILRTALARHIAAGALGGALQSECHASILRWSPGRNHFVRANLIRAFSTWRPAADLRSTLLQAFLDEHLECRRAASRSFAHVFGDDPTATDDLIRLAQKDVRAGVRAAALRGLCERPTWRDAARQVAQFNAASRAPELVLACITQRVLMGNQTAEDLQTLREPLFVESLEYGLREEVANIICQGWPRNALLRKDLLRILRQNVGTSEFEFPLVYLLRSYQGDEEIARIVSSLLRRHGLHLLIDKSEFWSLLLRGYRAHQEIAAALRAAVIEYKEKYQSILWHPNTAPAYAVLGDNEARDEVIAAYATADERSRYWIATTLIDGWSHDPIVEARLREWAAGSAELAAPLASFGKQIWADQADRYRWLERLIRDAADDIVSEAINALLSERPDDETRRLVDGRLSSTKLWYYHRVAIEARLAALYPADLRSAATIQRAFSGIDGPPLGEIVGAYQDDPQIRLTLLNAATPASADVRFAVVSLLRDRVVARDVVEQLTPEALAESSAPVRSCALIARARSCCHDDSPESERLADVLAEEAAAVGTFMDLRNRSAFVALLELGQLDRAVHTVRESNYRWRSYWVNSLEPDLVALQSLLKFWPQLSVALSQAGHDLQLPLEYLIDQGYGALAEGVPELRSALDAAVQLPGAMWQHHHYLELLARRFPASSALRKAVCRELRDPLSSEPLPRRRACLAAQLACDNFGGDEDVLAELTRDQLTGVPDVVGTNGVLGYFVLGWPQSTVAKQARAVAESGRAKWMPRDRLLCSIVWNNADAAEIAAREILKERFHFRFYSPENAEVLRRWARTASARPVLQRWRDSRDGDEAIASLALGIEVGDLDEGEVRRIFNATASGTEAPVDGFDSLTGRQLPWSVGAYAALLHRGHY